MRDECVSRYRTLNAASLAIKHSFSARPAKSSGVPAGTSNDNLAEAEALSLPFSLRVDLALRGICDVSANSSCASDKPKS